jgi:hypothetical protein
VYTLANPVAAGLVRSGREWPGLWSAPELIGAGPFTVERPSFFFRKKGRMPERVELELETPPGFAFAEEFRSLVTRGLAEREGDLTSAAAAAGRRFLGAERALAQDPMSRAVSEEPSRTLNPRFASRDPAKREEAIGRLGEFLRSYRAALGKLRQGVRDVLFPRGTYLLRVAHGVPCEAFG